MELPICHLKTNENALVHGFDSVPDMEENEQMMAVKGKPQFTDSEGKISFWMSVFNLSNAIMGSGILGLAYAMAQTGIIPFLILLIFIAIMSAYSIHLLLKSADVVGVRGYEMLGFRALGQVGKFIAACVVTIHNIGAMSTYLYIVKNQLPLIILGLLGKGPDFRDWYVDGNILIMFISAFIILPLAFMRRLGYLGYTSGLSLSCMVFFLISVIYKKFIIEYQFQHTDLTKLIQSSGNGSNALVPTVMSSHNDSDFMTTLIPTVMSSHNDSHIMTTLIPTLMSSHSNGGGAKYFTITPEAIYSIPIMAFAFVCHPEVLPIYTELRKPTKKRMQNVANISILAMFIMYLLTAIFGYLTFYDNVKDEFLKSYSTSDTLILCVRLAVLVAVTLTVPVVLFPIRRAILQLCCPNKPFHWVTHICIAICLLIFVNGLVIFVKHIKDIFGFIGATTAPSLIFILPGIFYIRLIPHSQEPLKSRPKILAFVFAVLGFIFMVGSISVMVTKWATVKPTNVPGH